MKKENERKSSKKKEKNKKEARKKPTNHGLFWRFEIAELTGKQHKNLMRDIRNMEPAWVKIAGLKFELGSYEDANGQMRPCYFLTKTEPATRCRRPRCRPQ